MELGDWPPCVGGKRWHLQGLALGARVQVADRMNWSNEVEKEYNIRETKVMMEIMEMKTQDSCLHFGVASTNY